MRDTAYWPRTFLDEVEGTVIENGPRLWALGGPSWLYRTGKTTIWIDPYLYGTPDESTPDAYRAVAIPVDPAEVRLADVIISTHNHIDHCHEGTLVAITQNTAAVCVAPKSSARLMREFGIADDRIKEVSAGDVFTIGDVEFSVYPSYDAYEPDAVSFVLSSGGTKLLVAGDTSDGPAMSEIGVAHPLDYALLAFGRTWYMNEESIIDVARKLQTRTLLPFHWEFWRNHTGDIGKLFEIYYRDRPNFDIKVLLVGDSIALTSSPR
jgi:L-ascorbate 6-phosphate lactonase